MEKLITLLKKKIDEAKEQEKMWLDENAKTIASVYGDEAKMFEQIIAILQDKAVQTPKEIIEAFTK
jgi:hypothetical protein